MIRRDTKRRRGARRIRKVARPTRCRLHPHGASPIRRFSLWEQPVEVGRGALRLVSQSDVYARALNIFRRVGKPARSSRPKSRVSLGSFYPFPPFTLREQRNSVTSPVREERRASVSQPGDVTAARARKTRDSGSPFSIDDSLRSAARVADFEASAIKPASRFGRSKVTVDDR